MPHGNDRNDRLRRILIIGAGATGRFLCRTLNRQKPRKYHIIGFVDDNPDILGIQIQKVNVYGPTSEIGSLINKLAIQQLVIAMPTVPARRVRGIIESVKERDVLISTIPSYLELIEGKQPIDDIRNIRIDDVLQREKIEIDTVKIAGEVAGKTVLVTGAAGSIGSELSRQVLQFRPAMLILLDQAESPLFYLERELASRADQTRIVPVVADITNGPRMMSLFQKYR
ncbi:MAG: nucleoside-diphosphate sugar epimerase/dehydratase, partial [Candidatus Latescibacterota bacterium]